MKKILSAIILLFMLWGLSTNLLAQGLDELGIVWKYTYPNPVGYSKSEFLWVTPQADNTYIASGSIVRNSDNRSLAYLVHYNEAGVKLKHFILEPPQDPQWTDTWWVGKTEAPKAYLKHVYVVGDDVIATGGVRPANYSQSYMPTSIKSPYSLGGQGEICAFLKGFWVTKFDYDSGTTSVNRLDDGMGWVSIMDTYPGASNDLYLLDEVIVTIDFHSNMNPAASTINALIRLYDYNLNEVARMTGTQGWPFRIEARSAGDEFEVISRTNIHSYKVGGTPGARTIQHQGLVFNPLTQTEGCLGAAGANDHIFSLMRKKTDGYWVGTGIPHYIGGINTMQGYAIYKKRNSGESVCETNSLGSQLVKAYLPPMPLASSTNKYVGTLDDQIAGVNKVYMITDDLNDPVNGNFTITDGAQLPYNAKIVAVSNTDGFFGGGTDGSDAGLVKFSTCAKFEAQISDFTTPYTPNLSISIPIPFSGAFGTVDYTLRAVVKHGTVNGMTEGDVLEQTNGTPVSETAGAGILLNLNRNYQLSTENVVIEYTLYMTDSYTTALGLPQNCSQTYVFRLIITPKSDVVSSPVIVKDGTSTKVKTTIKNIGEAVFHNYKIAIYEDTFENSNSYTYVYPHDIAIDETVRLEIDLPASLSGASMVVVSFNDNGSGEQDQLEINNKQLIYEVTP